jgi:hypothetical protein
MGGTTFALPTDYPIFLAFPNILTLRLMVSVTTYLNIKFQHPNFEEITSQILIMPDM